MNELPPWLQMWLGWIELHPGWSLLILAVAAGVEGLFIVGLFIPGSVLMFTAGALAANGFLNPWGAILAAALGAAVGDAISFWIGRRYRTELPRWTGRWQVLPQAEKFFARYGGSGILLGRLIGPLRPIVPAVAGASGYPPRTFVPVIIVACLIWALAYALPGMAVGATFALLAEMLGRLSLLLGALLLLLYLLYKLFATALTWSQRYAEPVLLRVIDWSHRHRRLGRLGPALADRDQPETPILAALLALLLSLGLLAEWGLQQLGGASGIMQWNLTLLDQAASFRSPWIESTALTLHRLAQPPMILGLTVCSAALFWLNHHRREAAHLVAGVVGGALLFAAVGHVANDPPLQLRSQIDLPGGVPTLGTAACLAFVLAGLLATRRRRWTRLFLYWLLATMVGLIGLATLLLGQVLPDRGLLLLLLSGLWAALITLGFRRHQARRGEAARLWPHGVVVALLVVLLPQVPGTSAATRLPNAELLQSRPDRLNLYWQGQPATVLEMRGWTMQRGFVWKDLRLYLSAAPFPELPAVPVLLNGHRPDQVWRRGNEILRLWTPQHHSQGSQLEAQWIGHYGRLRERNILGQLRLPLTELANWRRDAVAGTGLEGISQRYLRSQNLLTLRSP